MNERIDALTPTVLSLALDAASLRHQVLATNIASAGLPGRAAQRVSFEAHVANAAGSAPVTASRWAGEPALQVRMRAEPAAGGITPAVQLDAEVAALARNALHYQVLVAGLARHMALLALAVSEGRR
jgi:flagellar basal-body rod protein FlgB